MPPFIPGLYPTVQELAALRQMITFLEGDDRKNVLHFTILFWQANVHKRNDFVVSNHKRCTMTQANRMMRRIVEQGADSDWKTLAKAWVQSLRDEGFYYDSPSTKIRKEKDEGAPLVSGLKGEAVVKSKDEDMSEVKEEAMSPRELKVEKRDGSC